jgi:Aldehyde dehydrogenase family
VHRDVYDRFVDGLVDFARSYRMDDPTDPATTLGPLVRPAAAEFVRAQIQDAVAAGATAHLQPEAFPRDAPGSAYLAPQVLIDVIADQRAIPALPTIVCTKSSVSDQEIPRPRIPRVKNPLSGSILLKKMEVWDCWVADRCQTGCLHWVPRRKLLPLEAAAPAAALERRFLITVSPL